MISFYFRIVILCHRNLCEETGKSSNLHTHRSLFQFFHFQLRKIAICKLIQGYSFFLLTTDRWFGPLLVIKGAAWLSGLGRWVEIQRSQVQGLHPATSRICFLVVQVPSSNPRSRFVNSQLVSLLPVGIFNYIVCYVYLKYLFPLFQWHACEQAKLSGCIAKCMTTIN